MRAALVALLLIAYAAHSEPGLTYEQALQDGQSYSAFLVSYESSGLKVHAMVAVPHAKAPEGGYPVLIANHGYVPDPRKYGITADGINSRPGDYYRSVPELYASRGFMVVLPDYRGHNTSEGFEQIKLQDSAAIELYAQDVVELISLLPEIEHADMDKVFMWSHSMGGGVSLHALLATNLVKASSFWATMNVADSVQQLAGLDGPVIIHHSKGDQSTEHAYSEQLAAALTEIGHPVSFFSLDGNHHYFDEETREKAADRDTAFFLSH